MHRLAVLVSAAALAMVTLSGCVPFACTAIGYVNSVEIEIGDERIAAVGCADCDQLSTFSDLGGGRWRLSMDRLPGSVTLIGLDQTGGEVLREEHDPAWLRDEPLNPCGSNRTATTITLGAIAP